MNRSELEAILACTHSNMIPPHPSRTRRPRKEDSSVRAEYCGPPLSPKQHFQSHVRNLGQIKHTNLDTCKKLRRVEAQHQLQHVSSLRVNQHYGHSDLPNPQSSRFFANSREDPDFVLEERAAWRTSSQPSNHGLCQQSTTSSAEDLSAAVVLQPPKENSEPLPQPRKHQAQKLPLRSFEPLRNTVDLDERPKTRHGSGAAVQGGSQIRESEYDCESDSASITGTTKSSRRSKFLEGSMNQRSVAVASSWNDYGVRSEDEASATTEFDSTPRASREAHQPDSFEGDVSKSLPTTPATVKRGFLRFRSNVGSSEDIINTEVSKKKKKGLKKSISTWSFHNLGEKMRIFGGSTTDMTSPDEYQNNDHHNTNTLSADDHVNVPNERKRKASLAYGQLGLKKQKSNFGLANTDAQSHHTPAPVSSVRSRRSVSGASTITQNTASCRRRVSSGQAAPAATVEHLSENDLRKQKSRADLLKENQQLRQLLRESQSQHFKKSVSAHFSRNLEEYENEQTGTTPPKFKIPPVPSMRSRNGTVDRQVLGTLSNGGSNAVQSDAANPFRGQAPGLMIARPVSVIAEENEEELRDQIPEGNDVQIMGAVSNQQSQWEWPEDVF